MDNVDPGSLDYKILTAFLFKKDKLKPSELSEHLNIAHTTINSALKRMEENNLLNWHHYGKIELLDKGKEALKHIELHLHLIEMFLIESLNLSPEQAMTESLRLAPYFSCELIKRVCEKYDQPSICPQHNYEIPQFPKCHKHTD